MNETIFKKAEKMLSEKKPEFWKLISELENQKTKNKIMGKIEENVFIQGNVFLEKGALIKSGTRIEGNAFISKNSVIGPNTFLRGNVFISENCGIGRSEIKNSILLEKSRAWHFSYIGDSVIGKNVNFGAGSKIANLRLDNQTVKVDFFEKKVDSGRRKLGAVIKSGSSIGLNACINSGVIIGKNCRILPLTFVKKSMRDKEVAGF